MIRIAVLIASLAAAMVAPPAHAQLVRVFVSGHGDDSNPCTLAAPCRSFQQAYDVVAASNPLGAEIEALDSAGYGALAISTSISIQGHGFASIAQTSGAADAIDINAGSSDTILLNGLLLDGEGAGRDGVFVNTAGSVQIVNCVIRHFSDAGIDYAPTNPPILSVSNTIVSDNSAAGVFISGAGSEPITLDAVTATNNTRGLEVLAGQVTVTNSKLSNNPTGLDLAGGQAMVKTSVLANDSIAGVNARGGVAWLAKSAIYGSAAGVAIAGGAVNSFGDNDFANNGANVTGGSLGGTKPQ